MRVCTGCGEEKPLDQFYLDKRFGIPRSRCKPCCNDYDRRRRQEGYRPRLDPVLAQARRRRWEEKNPEWRKRYERAYYQRNKERIAAQRRLWMEQNPEKVRRWAEKRRAIKNGLDEHFTVDEWLALCDEFDWKCAACGKDEVTIDHVVPLSLGGVDTIDNIQPLCKPCNSKKGQQVIDYRGLRADA